MNEWKNVDKEKFHSQNIKPAARKILKVNIDISILRILFKNIIFLLSQK